MRDTRKTVEGFFADVRSGRRPGDASAYLAPEVLAHQVRAGASETVHRSPANYTEHVEEMLATYGRFELSIDELLVDGDKAYVRWTQRGTHVGWIDEYPPTGDPVETVSSCVYRVLNGLIVEYWMQQDEAGLFRQLERSKRAH